MWILIYCSCCFSCVSYEICYSYCLSWLLVALVFHGFCSSWYSRCSSCCCFSRFLVVFVFHGISPFWYSRCSCCFFWCLVILVSLMVVVFIGIHGVPLVPDCIVFLLWGLMLFLFLFLAVYVVNLVGKWSCRLISDKNWKLLFRSPGKVTKRRRMQMTTRMRIKRMIMIWILWKQILLIQR